MTGKGAALQGEGELEAGRALKAMGSMFAAKSRRKQLTYAISYGVACAGIKRPPPLSTGLHSRHSTGRLYPEFNN
jgi:hypothetical protein